MSPTSRSVSASSRTIARFVVLLTVLTLAIPKIASAQGSPASPSSNQHQIGMIKMIVGGSTAVTGLLIALASHSSASVMPSATCFSVIGE